MEEFKSKKVKCKKLKLADFYKSFSLKKSEIRKQKSEWLRATLSATILLLDSRESGNDVRIRGLGWLRNVKTERCINHRRGCQYL